MCTIDYKSMRVSIGKSRINLNLRISLSIGGLKNTSSQRERDEKRLGIKTANLIHQAVSVGQGLKATRPLEIVAIDHSLLPFYVLDNEHRLPVGLPWLTAATVKGLVKALLKATGDPLYSKGTTIDQTDRLYGLLNDGQVELIFLDEFHN
jgi:hypothetical protein